MMTSPNLEYKKSKVILREGCDGKLYNVYGVVVKCDQRPSVDSLNRPQDEYRLVINDGLPINVTFYTMPKQIPNNIIDVGRVVRFHRLKLVTFRSPELEGQKYLRGRVGGITSLVVFSHPKEHQPCFSLPSNYKLEAVDKKILDSISLMYSKILSKCVVQAQGNQNVEQIATSSSHTSLSNHQNGITSGCSPIIDQEQNDGASASLQSPQNLLNASADNNVTESNDEISELAADLDSYRFRNIKKGGGTSGYYDFVCEIVGIFDASDTVYLACFDGTRPAIRLQSPSCNLVPRTVNEDLLQRATAAGQIIYVNLFDNNVAAADSLAMGDIAWIINAHVYFTKALDGYMLVMHKFTPDNPFNRQITKISEDSQQYRVAKFVYDAAKIKLPAVKQTTPSPLLHGNPLANKTQINVFTPPKPTLVVPATSKSTPQTFSSSSTLATLLYQQADENVDDINLNVSTELSSSSKNLNDSEVFNNTEVNSDMSTSNISVNRCLIRRPHSPFRGVPLIDSQIVSKDSNGQNSPNMEPEPKRLRTVHYCAKKVLRNFDDLEDVVIAGSDSE